MHILQDDGIPRAESEEDTRVFFDDPHYIHYVGMINPPRPGFSECIQMLEHLHFAPGTLRNDLFYMRVVNWQGIIWGIVSIPFAEKVLMESMVQVNGLRIANGIPVMLGDGGVHKFPVDSKNFFVLENISGHPVYSQPR